jgi:hypothetical protein
MEKELKKIIALWGFVLLLLTALLAVLYYFFDKMSFICLSSKYCP